MEKITYSVDKNACALRVCTRGATADSCEHSVQGFRSEISIISTEWSVGRYTGEKKTSSRTFFSTSEKYF